MQNKFLVITGGLGFIGKNFTKFIADKYEKILVIDKNSAPSNNHKTADRKKENTRLTADNTGFDVVITLKHVNINKVLKMKKVINSIFMIY